MGFQTYQEYLCSDLWVEKKNIMLKKYPFCKDCGKKTQTVHHKTYERCPQEKEKDLVALCIPCHDIREKRKKK